MKPMNLSYVIVYVPDVPAAVAFYERALGLECRMLHDSAQYAEMETGATTLAFASEKDVTSSHTFRRNRPDEDAAGAEIAFVTEDVGAAYKRAITAGATPAAEPTEKPWGQVVSYVRDLNGFLIEICSRVGA